MKTLEDLINKLKEELYAISSEISIGNKAYDVTICKLNFLSDKDTARMCGCSVKKVMAIMQKGLVCQKKCEEIKP